MFSGKSKEKIGKKMIKVYDKALFKNNHKVGKWMNLNTDSISANLWQDLAWYWILQRICFQSIK